MIIVPHLILVLKKTKCTKNKICHDFFRKDDFQFNRKSNIKKQNKTPFIVLVNEPSDSRWEFVYSNDEQAHLLRSGGQIRTQQPPPTVDDAGTIIDTVMDVQVGQISRSI